MFEKVMRERLERIFDLGKVVYDKPSESREQQCVFIDVQRFNGRVKDGRQIGEVRGVLTVFANAEKLPYGYFAKKIADAAMADTRGFFFGPEENVGVIKNISERRFDFTFLFDSQYDPALGTITSVNFSEN